VSRSCPASLKGRKEIIDNSRISNFADFAAPAAAAA